MPFGCRLDLINFLLADVRGGLGPYVGIFLLGEAQWDQAEIGLVLTISGLIGISLHTPIGVFIDATPHKRALLIGGVGALAAAAVGIVEVPTMPVVLVADTIMAVLGAVFAPTVAAITVGLVPRQHLPQRLARNAACDRAGNIFAAATAGLAGWALSLEAVFYLVPMFAVLTAAAILTIPATAIDHDRARGLDVAASAHPHEESWRAILQHRPLLVLAGGMALFHFANAPILLLLGLELGQRGFGTVSLYLSSAIIAAQLVSIPVALLVGARADLWGRKPLLLAGFAALPMRLLLYALTDHPGWIVAGQLLDGVSLGTLDALLALVLADMMRGTGRYNAARGIVGTVQGIGGSASNMVAGLLVVGAGYAAAFATLAGIAAAAFLLILLALPETRPALVTWGWRCVRVPASVIDDAPGGDRALRTPGRSVPVELRRRVLLFSPDPPGTDAEMTDATSAGRVGAGEQIAQSPAPAQSQPDPSPVFRPVMQQMASLAQGADIAVPASTVRRVMIEMRGRQHDLGRPEWRILGQGRRGDLATSTVPRSAGPHPTSGHRPGGAPSRHAAGHRSGNAPRPARTGPSG